MCRCRCGLSSAGARLDGTHRKVKEMETKTEAKVRKVFYGVCINWNVERGFGFLKSLLPTRTVFIHRTSVEPDEDGFQDLEVGNKVRYFVGVYNKRPQAVDAVRITDEEYFAGIGAANTPVAVNQERTNASN